MLCRFCTVKEKEIFYAKYREMNETTHNSKFFDVAVRKVRQVEHIAEIMSFKMIYRLFQYLTLILYEI